MTHGSGDTATAEAGHSTLDGKGRGRMRDEAPGAADSALAFEIAEVVPEGEAVAPAGGLAVSALALAVAACGGGGGSTGGGGGGGGLIGGTPTPTVVKPQTDAEAARFILHASIAASTAAIADVRAQGYEPWLDGQMALANDQSAEDFFIARGYDTADSNQYYFSFGIADRMIWKQLMNGNSGVRTEGRGLSDARQTEGIGAGRTRDREVPGPLEECAARNLVALADQHGIANQVTTFTASDFGRTLSSNGDGSDHGWGSHHFILGGGVQGGRFYGRAPSVSVTSDDQVGQGRLLPTTSVDQYSATLARWFGVADSELTSVAPNIGRFATANLGFMG